MQAAVMKCDCRLVMEAEAACLEFMAGTITKDTTSPPLQKDAESRTLILITILDLSLIHI